MTQLSAEDFDIPSAESFDIPSASQTAPQKSASSRTWDAVRARGKRVAPLATAQPVPTPVDPDALPSGLALSIALLKAHDLLGEGNLNGAQQAAWSARRKVIGGHVHRLQQGPVAPEHNSHTQAIEISAKETVHLTRPGRIAALKQLIKD